ncbi:HupE/UreJ family protein [Nocardioides humi]|uniref:HupE / UreJ protein n=1 Tax=Nocardioides humi TaxID=449461 RepID=A0ABN2B719_9ACTN|nr:HupE/UreJ family protein [Nocardioides humi]
MPNPVRRLPVAVLVAAVVAVLTLGPAPGAGAHGFSSVVYADVTAPEPGHVRVELGLEYDLLVVSTADTERADDVFQDGTAAFEGGDAGEQADALERHLATVTAYVTKRFEVGAGGSACTPSVADQVTIAQREGVPYAFLVLDYACPRADAHQVTSRLFPDDEGYVRDTKTIVTYELDLRHGSAALDAGRPTFDTTQSASERFVEFFRLGAEHLLTGLDHILFLLALIAGSRRLREVVLVATTFTLAHSVTFVLAALGLDTVPGAVVEPVIALSIAVVAGWYLWRLVRLREHAMDLETGTDSHLALDPAGWTRLAVVFCFGLVHGLGFAGALGIDASWSWTLLWSLLVFNLGIEAVQLGIIALLFPALALLRHRAPAAGIVVTGLITAGVAVMGLVWFVQRVATG